MELPSVRTGAMGCAGTLPFGSGLAPAAVSLVMSGDGAGPLGGSGGSWIVGVVVVAKDNTRQ